MHFMRFVAVAFVTVLLMAGCSEKSTQPTDNGNPEGSLLKVGEGEDQGYKVELYSEKTFAVGYHRIYVKLTKTSTGALVDRAAVSVVPMMDMGAMKHSAPHEDHEGVSAINGLFHCAVNFIMAGMWELRVNFRDEENGTEGEVVMNINVAAGNMLKSVAGTDGKNYFITLVKPEKPVVGMNDFEITVHYRETMMSFPAVEDLAVKMEPTMPSMGHGSPNNVDPTHQQNGHYLGKVNFTMTGDWRVDLDLARGDSLLHTSFDITIP